jgi:hypothetical protein
MTKGEKVALAVGSAVALVFGGWYYAIYQLGHQATMPPTSEPQQNAQRTVTVGDTTIYVETVATNAARERGLSGRDNLAPNSGMLFVFDTDQEWGIWMKDMKFSIDILWLAQDGTVVTVAPNVSPNSYPQSFRPTTPARYVLELPAGFAVQHSIGVGSKFTL